MPLKEYNVNTNTWHYYCPFPTSSEVVCLSFAVDDKNVQNVEVMNFQLEFCKNLLRLNRHLYNTPFCH